MCTVSPPDKYLCDVAKQFIFQHKHLEGRQVMAHNISLAHRGRLLNSLSLLLHFSLTRYGEHYLEFWDWIICSWKTNKFSVIALAYPRKQLKIQMGLVNIWATELKDLHPLSYTHTPMYDFTATDSIKQRHMRYTRHASALINWPVSPSSTCKSTSTTPPPKKKEKNNINYFLVIPGYSSLAPVML